MGLHHEQEFNRVCGCRSKEGITNKSGSLESTRSKQCSFPIHCYFDGILVSPVRVWLWVLVLLAPACSRCLVSGGDIVGRSYCSTRSSSGRPVGLVGRVVVGWCRCLYDLLLPQEVPRFVRSLFISCRYFPFL